MNEIKDLVLKSTVIPAVMGFNYDQLNDQLDILLDDYRNLVVTDDTLQGCKNAKKELVSLRTRLEEFRKEKKSEAEKPVKLFDSQCKELSKKIILVEDTLGKSLDVYAEADRQKKRKYALDCIESAAIHNELRPEYKKRFTVKQTFTNVTTTLKSIREDIEQQAVYLKKVQDEYDKNISLIKETVSSENERIMIKLCEDDFISEFSDGKDIREVLRKIKRQAENILLQEQEMERRRIEEEKKCKEEEYLNHLAAAETAELDEGKIDIPEKTFSKSSCSIPHDDAAYPDENSFYADYGISRERSASQFEVVLKVTATCNEFKRLKEFLNQNFFYEVVSQKKV